MVARARACVGARFRLHGRSVASGLDCVGVAALAVAAARVPAGYAMRGGDAGAVAAVIDGLIDGLGLARGAGAVRPGDLMLLRAGPYQLHLAIRTDAGFVHADALLRRVTEVPGAPPWPLLGCWRAS